jgi:hypothetical protein
MLNTCVIKYNENQEGVTSIVSLGKSEVLEAGMGQMEGLQGWLGWLGVTWVVITSVFNLI